MDDSYFDSEDLPPHFDEQPKEQASFRAPIGATSFNFNSFAIWVRPGKSVGSPAVLTLDPVSDYFTLDNQVATVASGRNRVTAILTPDRNGMTVTMKGQVRSNASSRQWRFRIEDPAKFAGGALRAALRKFGVRVRRKKISEAKVPEDAFSLVAYNSPPLSVLARGPGKYSNNYMAEMLLKTIGAETGNALEAATTDEVTEAARRAGHVESKHCSRPKAFCKLVWD